MMDEDTRDGLDLYYNIKIEALKMYEDACFDEDEFELGQVTRSLGKIVEEQYIAFRLKEYDSEARMVIGEAYKVLGYNPYNPKQNDNRKA